MDTLEGVRVPEPLLPHRPPGLCCAAAISESPSIVPRVFNRCRSASSGVFESYKQCAGRSFRGNFNSSIPVEDLIAVEHRRKKRTILRVAEERTPGRVGGQKIRNQRRGGDSILYVSNLLR